MCTNKRYSFHLCLSSVCLLSSVIPFIALHTNVLPFIMMSWVGSPWKVIMAQSASLVLSIPALIRACKWSCSLACLFWLPAYSFLEGCFLVFYLVLWLVLPWLPCFSSVCFCFAWESSLVSLVLFVMCVFHIYIFLPSLFLFYFYSFFNFASFS